MVVPPKLAPTGLKTWGVAIVNQAALPGLGSVVAGRRVGWPQMLLAFAGFGLTIWWAIGFVAEWVHTGQPPLELNARFGAAVGGVALFIIAWFWSLATSLAILRAANEPRSTTRPET